MFLVIDSSLNGYAAALVQDQDILFSFSNNSKSQHLVTELKKAFNDNKLNLEDLSSVLVNIGPGSFTGIRTALTVVKALEANLKLKVFTVNNFELLRFLNPSVTKFAFRASVKNDREFFVSLSTDYANMEENYFTAELESEIEVLELPQAKDLINALLDYFKAYSGKLKASDSIEIQPYYLREPSLRLPKTNAAK